jgi:hypothetical protein
MSKKRGEPDMELKRTKTTEKERQLTGDQGQ